MRNQSLRFWGLLCACLLASAVFATAQIQVNSTSPNSAPQGTTNLNVTVSGSGFKKGAKAQWFVSGTTNPGGVTVNSTTSNGSSSLTANITIANNATLSGFDVVVTNTDGRTGVGRDAFTVTPPGTPIGCTTSGKPSGATLVTVLNPVDQSGRALLYDLYGTQRLGDAIRVRPLNLNGHIVLVAFVTSGSGSGSIAATYVFFLDPGTGLPLANNPANGTAWQNPMLLLKGYRNNQAAAGDVNSDGVPDFVQAGGLSTPYLFVGSVDSNFNPSWNAIPISPPASASVALGDVDGIGVDEIVFGGSSAVSIYKYTSGSVSYLRQIQDPSGASRTGFGNAVAIGNIGGNVGGTGNNLAVGAPSASTGGLVYVFPPKATQTSTYFTLTGPGGSFGRNLGIADVTRDGIPDLLVISGSGSGAAGLLYPGYVSSTSSYVELLPGQANGGWGMPNIDLGDMAAAGAIAVGAPQTTTCGQIQGGIGALNLYTSPFTSGESPIFVFETPYPLNSNQYQFGYSVGIAPGYPFIVVGEHFRDVGTTSMAGQVYVYKIGN